MIAKASIILPARNNHDHIITRVVSLSPSEITAACWSDDEKGIERLTDRYPSTATEMNKVNEIFV